MARGVSRTTILVAVLAIAALARVLFLDKSFQGDEFLSVLDARTLAGIPDALLTDTHPPLYFYLLHLWMRLSMSEAFLRLLSVAPGLGLVWLVFLAGERLAGPVSAALGALLVALAPVAVWSSQYIRTYALGAFFMVLSGLILADLVSGRRGGRAGWAAYVLASAASVYTFYFSALVLIAQNVFVALCMRGDREFLKKWFLAQVSIAILYLPWIPFFIFQRTSYVGHPQMAERIGFFAGGVHVGAVVRSFSGLAGLDPRCFARTAVSADPVLRAFLVGCAVAGFVAAAVVARRFSFARFSHPERRELTLHAILGTVPFVVAMALHQASGIILMSHYFIASFAFLTVFSVAMLTRAVSSKAMAAICGAIMVLYAGRLGFLYHDKEMDFKGVRAYVMDRFGPGAAIIAPSFGGIFDYYFHGARKIRHMEDMYARPIHERELVVISYPRKLELAGIQKRFAGLLDAGGFARAASRSFGDLLVERYSRP